MEDEKKVYPVVGTVTISTEEYRDLIERCKNLEADVKEAENNYWKKYRECSDRESALKNKDREIDALMKYKDYIFGDEERKSAYKKYLTEQLVEESEEGDY